jgi:mRNA interferase MazF
VIQPGAVILVDFPGVKQAKPRPAVVISSDMYHRVRADIVVALLTSKLAEATTVTDYVLQDWAAAGLHVPSAFRSFFATLTRTSIIREIGQLTDRDWLEIQSRLRIALAV